MFIWWWKNYMLIRDPWYSQIKKGIISLFLPVVYLFMETETQHVAQHVLKPKTSCSRLIRTIRMCYLHLMDTLFLKNRLLNCWDGSVSEGAYLHAQWQEFSPWDSHEEKRELTHKFSDFFRFNVVYKPPLRSICTLCKHTG